MTRRNFLFLLAGSLILARIGQSAPQTPRTMPLQVMTFNLRYASATPPNAWSARRLVTSEMLRQNAPDLIGTQEGLYAQIQDIARDRPEYSWIGDGREGGSRGEFGAVFYRRDRLQPLEYDHFWLSDTPDRIGSNTWGNGSVRMVTWVKFRDLRSQREFYFWNTHLDNQSQSSREKSAALIATRVKALGTNLPVILSGDFNAAARANRAYDTLLEAGFADAWFGAAQRAGQNYATFHGYQKPVPDGAHIDWILTRGAVQSLSARVVSFERDGQYPSDHFPVMATLQLGGS